jgi:glycosyltransferase involved in cell wall biosynthesis
MKRILYFNLNVGSAIQHAGNIFGSWIKETLTQNGVEFEFKEIADQDQSYTLFESIISFKPDIIILNERYQKTYESTLYYKKAFPETKIFYIQHVWNDLNLLTMNIDKIPEERGVYDKIKYREFMNNNVDYIFNINYKPDGNFDKWPTIKHKIFNFSYPTDPEVWKVTTPWKDRPGKFVYVGNIVPHKMSKEFVKKIKDTNISIDCYGRNEWDLNQHPEFKEYLQDVKETPNLVLKGLQPQSEIPNIYNKYKYFVLPHDGYEPFNWALLQAISCGTVPLVVNDRVNGKFDPTWIDWAEGLYLGTDTVDQLIENLNIINTDETIDMSDTSSLISDAAHKKFNYAAMKSKFSELLMNLVNNNVVYSIAPVEQGEEFEFETIVTPDGGEKTVKKVKCSSHNSNYNSVDNNNYDSAVDGSNDTGVLDYN